MSQIGWRIGTDTPDYGADDMTGSGAKIVGGRWNRAGTAMIYAAGTRALACLETVVHSNAYGLPFNRYLVQLSIPDALWKRREELTAASAPVGWDALPEGLVSLNYGTEWAKSNRSAILVVPSVIVPEEQNILINPQHPDGQQIIATKVRRWLYDQRLFPAPVAKRK